MTEQALFIINSLGVVHLVKTNSTTCPEATRYLGRVPVSTLQCLVYKLPACTRCWKYQSSYETYIRRGLQ